MLDLDTERTTTSTNKRPNPSVLNSHAINLWDRLRGLARQQSLDSVEATRLIEATLENYRIACGEENSNAMELAKSLRVAVQRLITAMMRLYMDGDKCRSCGQHKQHSAGCVVRKAREAAERCGVRWRGE